MRNKQREANLALFMASLIWGVAFVAQREGVRYVGAFYFGAIRFTLGALSMLPILLLMRSKEKNDSEKSDNIKSVPLLKTLPAGLILGSVLFFAATFQQLGLYYTTAGKAGFITDLYIIIVPVIEIFFGRKLKKIMWLCVALAVVGLYLISVNENFSISQGDVLVFIGSFLWAGHIMLIDNYSKRYNPVRLSVIQYLVTAILSLIVALAVEKVSFYGIYKAALPILFTGILSVGVAYTLQIIGQKHAKASHAAIILSMESVVSWIAGILILHESMSLRGIIGCVLMASAMVLTQAGGSVNKKKLCAESSVPQQKQG
ncbi:MAG TPA: DMT family transporter [Ruminiclostridium sp.]|nr:DMT family transporter [Ruminiclostridium sp.]